MGARERERGERGRGRGSGEGAGEGLSHTSDSCALAVAMIKLRSLDFSSLSAANSTGSSKLSTHCTCKRVHASTSHTHVNGEHARFDLQPSLPPHGFRRPPPHHLLEHRGGLRRPGPARECKGGRVLQPRNLHRQPLHTFRRICQRARHVLLHQLRKRSRRVDVLVCLRRACVRSDPEMRSLSPLQPCFDSACLRDSARLRDRHRMRKDYLCRRTIIRRRTPAFSESSGRLCMPHARSGKRGRISRTLPC